MDGKQKYNCCPTDDEIIAQFILNFFNFSHCWDMRKTLHDIRMNPTMIEIQIILSKGSIINVIFGIGFADDVMKVIVFMKYVFVNWTASDRSSVIAIEEIPKSASYQKNYFSVV